MNTIDIIIISVSADVVILTISYLIYRLKKMKMLYEENLLDMKEEIKQELKKELYVDIEDKFRRLKKTEN